MASAQPLFVQRVRRAQLFDISCRVCCSSLLLVHRPVVAIASQDCLARALCVLHSNASSHSASTDIHCLYEPPTVSISAVRIHVNYNIFGTTKRAQADRVPPTVQRFQQTHSHCNRHVVIPRSQRSQRDQSRRLRTPVRA